MISRRRDIRDHACGEPPLFGVASAFGYLRALAIPEGVGTIQASPVIGEANRPRPRRVGEVTDSDSIVRFASGVNLLGPLAAGPLDGSQDVWLRWALRNLNVGHDGRDIAIGKASIVDLGQFETESKTPHNVRRPHEEVPRDRAPGRKARREPEVGF